MKHLQNIERKRVIVKLINLLLCIAILMLTQGCAKFNPSELNPGEQQQYEKLQRSNVHCPEVVSPSTAATLNFFLPAGGDFYLGAGEYADENVWPDAGVKDFLSWFVIWPIGSMISAPRAHMMATSINKRACIVAHKQNNYTQRTERKTNEIVYDGMGNRWGNFNQGNPQEHIKKTGQIPIITTDSPEYKERYQ